MNWYALVWHDICLGHIEFNFALEIYRLKKLDIDLEKTLKYALKELCDFWGQGHKWTWPQGYTDSYINIWIS